MTLQDDKRKRSPRDRFRNILAADQEDEGATEPHKPTVVNLPRVGAAGQEPNAELSGSGARERSQPGSTASPRVLPTFWTVGGILSIIANFILFFMLLSGGSRLNSSSSAGGALLGVYASLEQMDQAHIRAKIPVQTTAALDASVPVKSTTSITLARDVFVHDAHVQISTDQFNIDAPADITLPAGTVLEAALDMNLPLQTIVPIAMDIPVEVAVRDTELHAAIQGLKDSIRPLLCAASPGVMLPDGQPACR